LCNMSCSPGRPNASPLVENRVAGSKQHPFKLAIIGGGPSGCSILVRAVRIGMLPELCQFSPAEVSPDDNVASVVASSTPSSPTSKLPSSSPSIESQGKVESPLLNEATSKSTVCYAGVCVIDAGTMERIGGGRLQDYVINSNTWINKFATNVTEEKLNNLPPESVRGSTFDSLQHSASTKQLEEFGNKAGPLKLVGHFLRDVGQRAMAAVQAFPTSSKFYVRTKVESLHRVVENGKFLCWKLVLASVGNQSTAPNENGDNLEVFALHVAMATGGHQTMPNFVNPAYRHKTMLSDVVCTMEGVELLKTRIHRYLRACTNHGTLPAGRIVVIGGSHSAFSAAWVCLNLVNEDSTLRLLTNNGTIGGNSNTLLTATSAPISLNGHNQIKFGPSGVCILHRSAIRVFYASRADADHDHYPESCIVVNRITGNINPFGGIRGDAKELWRAIRSAKESRIRLLQVKQIPLAANTSTSNSSSSTSASNGDSPNGFSGASGASMKQSIVDKMLEEAIVIVWAAGYSTNMIPIYDHDGRPIQIRMSKGQAEVDEHANLLLSEHHHGRSCLNGFQPSSLLPSDSTATATGDFQGIPVGNLFGSGLGFGLKASLDNGEPDGSSGRADGVAVYLKRGATLILANVLGNKVYGGLNIQSWEERNQMLKKQQRQQEQGLTLNVVSRGSESSPLKLPANSASSSSGMMSPPRRNSTLLSPTRVATASGQGMGRSLTPGQHREARLLPPSTAIGLCSPQQLQNLSNSAVAGSPSLARRPSSTSRVRTATSCNINASTQSSSIVGSIKEVTKAASIVMDSVTDSASAVAALNRTAEDALDQHQRLKDRPATDKEKLTLIQNVSTHLQLQNQLQSNSRINNTTQSNINNSNSNNQINQTKVTSVSEPGTPATSRHPSSQQQHQQQLTTTSRTHNGGSHRALGSAGRAVVTGTMGSPSPGSKASSKQVQAQALRNSIDNSSKHSKVPMPNPLSLKMGSAEIVLPAHSSSIRAGKRNGQHRSLLSSSLK
jgi:hypothetical protein